MNVADLLGNPRADWVALTHKMVCVVGVQTFHAVGRAAADAAGTIELVQPVAPSPVVGVGGGEGPAELLVRPDPRRDLLHHTRCFQPSDGLRSSLASEPIQSGERFAVHEGMRLDNGRQTAGAAMRDTDLPAQTAAELLLDDRPVCFVQSVSPFEGRLRDPEQGRPTGGPASAELVPDVPFDVGLALVAALHELLQHPLELRVLLGRRTMFRRVRFLEGLYG